MRILLLVALAALLAACVGKPPQPDWKKDSVSLIEKYKKAELKGENRLAERYFEQALAAAGSAAGLQEAARLHLVRCATRQASLQFEPCAGYLAFSRHGVDVRDDAYHRFLTGQWEGLDADLLPAQYRALPASRDGAKNLALLQEIDDPLSRLIAVSAMAQRRQANEAALGLAVETAAQQGWRKPLLVYLRLLENRAASRADQAALDRLRTRIKLVEESF